MTSLTAIACIVGFVGDFLLQTGTKLNLGGQTGWGLKDYFSQHGPIESLFIAGGMMTLFYVIYLYILKLKPNFLYLAIYGVILDFLFRKLNVFSSLKGYYNYFGYFWSAVWGAIPLILPYLVFKLMKLT